MKAICDVCSDPFEPTLETRELRTEISGVLELVGLGCGCAPVGRTRAQWHEHVKALEGSDDEVRLPEGH